MIGGLIALGALAVLLAVIVCVTRAPRAEAPGAPPCRWCAGNDLVALPRDCTCTGACRVLWCQQLPVAR